MTKKIVDKVKFEVIYVVLTYGNTTDIMELIESLEKTNNYSYKIIVVNNYYDEYSLKTIKKLCFKENFIFIESENKGYSIGNNIGIQYAIDNFYFDYLVVSNPDIKIEKLRIEQLKKYSNSIIAPEIISGKGRKQNPLYFREIISSDHFIYKGMTEKNKIIFYFGILMNKANKFFKRIKLLFTKKEINIFSPHGSFIIFSEHSIKLLNPVFDSNMFLFAEEGELAQRARESFIKIFYDRSIIVHHKEDGSMKLRSDINEQHIKSYTYYYKKWISKKEKEK